MSDKDEWEEDNFRLRMANGRLRMALEEIIKRYDYQVARNAKLRTQADESMKREAALIWENAKLRAENDALIETLQQPDQVGYWQRRCELAEEKIDKLRAAQ